MEAKIIESKALNIDEMKQKRKIKLIIISKKGKLDEEKEKSKITLKKEKGQFNIRMENMTQTLNKNKIDEVLKSLIQNISDFSRDKNKENIHTSIDLRSKENRNNFLYKDNNDFCDIYLEKNKKDFENKIKQKKEEINEENILFKKIKIFEKDKKENLKNIQVANNDDKNIIINDNIKASNRELLKENESESMNDKINTNRELESPVSKKNNVINSNLNVNNFFQNNKTKNSLVMINSTKTKEFEDNKNDINIYNLKNILNNNNLNNINYMSRNNDRQLILKKNSEIYNQSTNFFQKAEQNISDSKFGININNNNNLNRKINFKNNKNICSICGVKYNTYLFFVAECNLHFLCKKCAKSFYEERIEMGAKELFCPFIFCRKKFSKGEAKKFLSKRHYEILIEEEKNNNLNTLKLINNNNNIKEMKNYSENHVLDINNNKIFYNFNKNKNIFCSKCNNQSLFCREKQLFMRCLFCNFEQCKYCFKEYTHDHFDMNSNNYCRIYYRDSEMDKPPKSCINIFIKQLLLVFASFFLTIISIWKLSKQMFMNYLFKLNEKNNNCIVFYLKMIFIYILTLIIFAILFPVNIIMFPWFPSFLALFDYS